MIAQQLRRALGLASIALLAGGVAACDTDRAIVSEPFTGDIVSGRFAPDGRNAISGTAYYVNWNEDDDPAEDEILLDIAGLESLSTGAYQVWLARVVNDEVVSSTRATGFLVTYRADTVFNNLGDIESVDVVDDAVGTVSSWQNGGSNIRVEYYIPAAQLGNNNAVVVTIGDPAATTQDFTGARPLWATDIDVLRDEVIDGMEFFLDTPLLFGTFDPDAVSGSYRFTGVGRGLASFLNATTLMVADSALARPPVGYYYATSVIGRNLARQPIDTLIIGEQTAPAPRRSVSLRDADINTVDPVVQSRSILAAANLFRGTGTPFTGLNEVTVHLETKAGIDLVAPMQVLVAPVPTGYSTPATAP